MSNILKLLIVSDKKININHVFKSLRKFTNLYDDKYIIHALLNVFCTFIRFVTPLNTLMHVQKSISK